MDENGFLITVFLSMLALNYSKGVLQNSSYIAELFRGILPFAGALKGQILGYQRKWIKFYSIYIIVQKYKKTAYNYPMTCYSVVRKMLSQPPSSK